MLDFGLELEGFYSLNNKITIPPLSYPTDGFPGLVEFRTFSYAPLEDCYYELIKKFNKYDNIDFKTHTHEFSRSELALIRKRQHIKERWDINNIYNKLPRKLGNKTIASLQISFSEMRSAKDFSYSKLFDFIPYIRNLDEEFKNEIESAGRQIGWYCFKDNRIEYRSLPNSVFEPLQNGMKLPDFISRIKNCFE